MFGKSTLCINNFFYLSLESWKSQALLMTERLWCCAFIFTLQHSNRNLQIDLGQMSLKASKAALKLYRSIQNERLQGQHELGPVWITGKSTSHWLANANPTYKPMVFEMREYCTGLEVNWEIWRTGRRICWHCIPWGQNQQNSFGSWYLKVVDLLTADWPACWSNDCPPQFFIFRQWNCLAFGRFREYLSVFTHVNWYSNKFCDYFEKFQFASIIWRQIPSKLALLVVNTDSCSQLTHIGRYLSRK